jgi:hypothetical protein
VQPFGQARGQELKPNDKVASRIQDR